MRIPVIDRWAEQTFVRALRRSATRHGRATLHLPSGVHTLGDEGGLEASLHVHHPRFFRRVLAAGEIGFGDAYMDGDWSTPDLVSLIRLTLANRDVMSGLPAAATRLSDAWEAVAHRRRDNTRTGSRRNIRRHYDLGNDFFGLFLDPSLMYSCAVYARAHDSLEAAQANKLRLICDKLQLSPRDHVLEIGTGWGGFALFAARHYGCRVTSTTISAAQHAYATGLMARSGEAGARVAVRLDDYRDVRGRFDKIVSIEMFEAVGLRHYDDFFGACDRLLAPDGAMLLQTITVDDWRFRHYRSAPNWIAKHIFPGSELASVAEILASLARTSRLGLHHAEQIGTHYARTLHQWRQRFHQRIGEVRAQGFDDRFVRMWDLYLGYCEAAFLERHLGVAQLLMTRATSRRALFGEPWEAQDAGCARASDPTRATPRFVRERARRQGAAAPVRRA